MLRIGIAGFGRMGRRHYSKYQAIDGAWVSAIADVDVNAMRWLGDPRVARFSDPFEMIDHGAVDVVDVCAPTDVHAPLSIAANLAGKHVICEKPMATRSRDALEMLDASRDNGRMLLIAHVVRFWPEYVRLCKVMDGGELGRLLALSMSRYRASPGWTRLPSPASMDLMVHDVDFVTWGIGHARHVGARSVLSSACEVCDACAIVEGIHVNWRSTRRAGPDVFEATFAADFERGSVLYNSRSPVSSLEILTDGGEQGRAGEWYDPYEHQLRMFVEMIERGQYDHGQEPETALASLRIMERIAGLSEQGDERQ